MAQKNGKKTSEGGATVVDPSKKASKVAKLTAKIGDEDSHGNTLQRRVACKDGVMLDAWLSKGMHVVYIGIPTTDNTGEVLRKIEKFKSNWDLVDSTITELGKEHGGIVGRKPVAVTRRAKKPAEATVEEPAAEAEPVASES
jgi:hypothetical protein